MSILRAKEDLKASNKFEGQRVSRKFENVMGINGPGGIYSA